MSTTFQQTLREMAQRGELKPEHPICPTNVEKPTLAVVELQDGNRSEVRVQWYGAVKHEDELPLPPNSQFQFTVFVNPQSPSWVGHPERFQVAFLGPVKDWPHESEAVHQQIADVTTEGNLDGWIIWVISHHFHQQRANGKGNGPGSFVSQIAMLGDPMFGIITPQPFTDLSIKSCPQCT